MSTGSEVTTMSDVAVSILLILASVSVIGAVLSLYDLRHLFGIKEELRRIREVLEKMR